MEIYGGFFISLRPDQVEETHKDYEMISTTRNILRQKLREIYFHFLAMDTATLVLPAILVGLIAGFGAIFFRWLIESIRTFSFDEGKEILSFLSVYYVIAIPTIGGIFVGLLTYFFAREAKGHGVPEVMEAVALRNGHIRPIVAIVKTFASAICIGTGGSVGREGPIVQIGSTLGSMLGTKLNLSGDGVRTLVACGAAGGIAATFNAPIAGAIFAAEVILSRFSTGYFVPIVIASVTANEVSRIFLGNAPAFAVPEYILISAWELPLYAILGFLSACVAALFIFTLYRFEDFFDSFRFPEYLKPAIGGLFVGLIGVYFPQIFGVGYEVIEEVLRNGTLNAQFLLFLLLIKVVATSFTLGSGGSGGVFAPSLFLGAMLGGGFGSIVHAWLPAITSSSGAYALVGMAAVFAGAAQAPITAVLILFEMTRDYGMILPLAFAVAFSTVVLRLIYPGSIYTLKIKRKGIDISAFENVDLMRTIHVKDAMSPADKLVTVKESMSLSRLTSLFAEQHSHGFAVTENGGTLVGVVTLSDLEAAILSGNSELSVGDICTRNIRHIFPDQTLEEAMSYFGSLDIGRIPVVDHRSQKKLIGMLGRGDIIRAFSKVIVQSQPQAHSPNNFSN